MGKIEKGSKVKVTNFCGQTEEPDAGPNYRLIGQEGYVTEILHENWLIVKVPTHRYHSKGEGVLLNFGEVELIS